MSSSNSPRPPSHAGRRRSGRAQMDDVADPYKQVKKAQGPIVCPQCRAVYHDGRWRWSSRPDHAREELCQACHRINDRYPAGIVTLSGPLVAQHGAEMIRLARNQEEAEKQDHPLNRIIDIEEAPERLVINTTDIHLPRRIGEAQKRAYHGKLDLNYDEDGYFVRVNWHHDG